MPVGDWSELPPLSPPAGVDPEQFADAVDVIRDFCGWHIAPVISEDLVLDGSGARLLPLNTKRVVSVSDVAELDTPLEEDDYRLALANYLSKRYGYWSSLPSSVTMTLQHGYEELPRAVRVVAGSLIDNAAAGGSGRVTAGPFTITGSESGASAGVAGFNDYQIAALRPYMLGNRLWA